MPQTATTTPSDEGSTHTRLKKLILADPTFHLPSRLAWLMTDVSATSGFSNMKRQTIYDALNAKPRQIDLALRSITEGKKRKLFIWDDKARAYRCNYRRGETPQAFKARVQKTVNVKLGVAWVLRDIVECNGFCQPAPHSNAEFARQLGRRRRAITHVMSAVLETGYFRRYQRPRRAPLYTRFDDVIVNAYEAKYDVDPRTENAIGVNPKVIQLFGDSREAKSRFRGRQNLDSREAKSRSGPRRYRPNILKFNTNSTSPIYTNKQLASFGSESSSERRPAAARVGRRDEDGHRDRGRFSPRRCNAAVERET